MIWKNYRAPKWLTFKELMGFLKYINKMEEKTK